MKKKKIGIVVLAAGKGTRLKIATPKPLLPILGLSLIDYVLMELETIKKSETFESKITLITGHAEEKVKDYLQNYKDLNFITQKVLDGTASAIKVYFEGNPENKKTDYTLITCADTPLISSDIYEKILTKINQSKAIAATFRAHNPFGYGRILRADKGFNIREEKDASEEERRISEVNSGVYLVETPYLLEKLNHINSQNQANEFYLTDIFSQNENVEALLFENAQDFLGVNDLTQLEEATQILKRKKNTALMKSGVYFENTETTTIDWKVKIAAGVKLSSALRIEGESTIEEGTKIEQGCVLKDARIGKNVDILAYSYIENTVVEDQASIGPFARLRPLTKIGKKAKIGNFVEVKKSQIGRESKVSHLSYVGDAEIGDEVNIGCGFITCNYDGINKHKTKIGKGSFVGSACQTIAPLEIGEKAFIAAGSTLTKNIPEGGFALARSPQVNKEGMAQKFLKEKPAKD